MEGTFYPEQTVTTSRLRALAWNIKPLKWKIKIYELLQEAWDLEKCFSTTWASIGSLYTFESHPIGRIQNAGKQSADKNTSAYEGKITINRKMNIYRLIKGLFLLVKGPAADVTDTRQPWGLFCNPVMKMKRKIIIFFCFFLVIE
jgi:hypothetical protein